MVLVEVQKDRKGSGTLESGNYNFFYGEGNANHQLRTGFFLFIDKRRSAVKRVEYLSGYASCITLKGRLCDIIIVNVHALSED